MYFLDWAILCHHLQTPLGPGSGGRLKSQQHKNSLSSHICSTLRTFPNCYRSNTNDHENPYHYAYAHSDAQQHTFANSDSLFH